MEEVSELEDFFFVVEDEAVFSLSVEVVLEDPVVLVDFLRTGSAASSVDAANDGYGRTKLPANRTTTKSQRGAGTDNFNETTCLVTNSGGRYRLIREFLHRAVEGFQ